MRVRVRVRVRVRACVCVRTCVYVYVQMLASCRVFLKRDGAVHVECGSRACLFKISVVAIATAAQLFHHLALCKLKAILNQAWQRPPKLFVRHTVVADLSFSVVHVSADCKVCTSAEEEEKAHSHTNVCFGHFTSLTTVTWGSWRCRWSRARRAWGTKKKKEHPKEI